MRLDKVTMRGIGPFRDAVTLDMAQLGDAVLVAVCGDNGEGKSTLLEFAIPGAFYRDTPTQGSLKSRATARDSLLEVVVTGDATYRIKHLMDATSGKGTSVVLDPSGKPVYGTTLVSDFDLWSARHLPQRDVLLASVFGAQQDAGFLGELPGGRMAILLRALGIARYEKWATRANKRACECKQQLEVTRARLAEARRTGGDVSLLAPAFEAAKDEAVRADAELATARQALASLEAGARAATASTAAREAHIAKQAEVRIRIDMLKAKRVDLDTRIAACQQTLAREADIKSAATKSEGLRLQMEELTLQRGTLASREESLRERQRSAAAQAEQARSHSARVSRRIEELEKTLAQGAAIAQAERDVPELEAGLVVLRQGVASAQIMLEELTAATVAGVEDRIVDLKIGLDGVVEADELTDAQRIATAAVNADAEAIKAAAERPAKLAAARKAVEVCRGLITAAEERYQRATALARRAGELTAAREQIAALRTELAEHAETLRTQQAIASQAAAEAHSCKSGLDLLEGKQKALGAQVGALAPLAAQLPNIALARTRLDERRAQLTELVGELEPAEQMLAAIGPAPEALPPVDVEPQRAWSAGREKAAVAAHQAVAVAALRLEAARSMEEQLRALAEQQQAEEAELGDWTRLGGDLGRQGLQAAEIDSCGPELTALVNDLLHSCHGPRYTVRIDTQRPSSDGKKTIEGCQVTVIDTVRGREDEGRLFSGGERVIIGEALALGLSMLACQRSGLRGVTLVRDETGAALSVGNAEVYLRMLRRAAKQIGADRVFFVCHSPETAELADARITVEGGKLTVDAQAGQVAA